MIAGVGIDIVELKRFRQIMGKRGKSFINRLFSEREIDYVNSKVNRLERLAGRFAVKEAVLKALGTGLNYGISWHNIEIKSNRDGSVNVVLNGDAERYAKTMAIKRFFVSISHTENYACAVVIAER